MRQDDFDRILTRFPEGTSVSGVVRVRAPFGVFVDFAPDVCALLELPEMSFDAKRYGVDDPYTVGSVVTARVFYMYNWRQVRLSQTGTSPTAA